MPLPPVVGEVQMANVGVAEGTQVGRTVGLVGLTVGAAVGSCVGTMVGLPVGFVGLTEGLVDGIAEGLIDGIAVGTNGIQHTVAGGRFDGQLLAANGPVTYDDGQLAPGAKVTHPPVVEYTVAAVHVVGTEGIGMQHTVVDGDGHVLSP